MESKTVSDIANMDKKSIGNMESKEGKSALLDDTLIELYNDLHDIRNELDLISYTRMNDNDMLREYQEKLLSIENEYKHDGIWNGNLSINKIPKGQAMVEAMFDQCHKLIKHIQDSNESSDIHLVDKSLYNVYNALVEIRDNLTKLRLTMMKQHKTFLTNPNIVYSMNGELQHYQHLLDQLETANRGDNMIWGSKDALNMDNILKGQAVLNELLDKSYVLVRQIAFKIEQQFKTNPILLLYRAKEEGQNSDLTSSIDNSSLSTKDLPIGELKTEINDSPYGYIIKVTIPKEFNVKDLRVGMHEQLLMVQAKHTNAKKEDYNEIKSSYFLSKSLPLKEKVNADAMSSRFDQNKNMLLISVPKV